MRLDKNCIWNVTAIYLVFAVLNFLSFRFVRIPLIVYPFLTASIWFCVWQTYFHTVPQRLRKGDSHIVTAVSDGRIIFIDKVFEGEYLKQDCLKVSIYMNFFDVHANFWPVDGEVEYFKLHKGAHFYANNPKSSLENEHSCVCVKNIDGQRVFFKQIAGGFARRIVCSAKVGENVSAGSQCGIIKFGSRIDMFFPLDTKIVVSLGDLVRASETIIAHLPK